MTLQDKLSIVTGAASGIGRETALLFARRGARVVALDRDDAGLEALAADAEAPVVTRTINLTDDGLDAAVSDLLDTLPGRLDVLVNNAGVGGGDFAEATEDAAFRRYFDINVIPLFRLSRLAVSRMRDGGGAIVNVASIYAEIGATRSPGYSASKGAVASLTRQMATDYGPYGIRVNAVAPGLIETPLTAERIRTELWRRQIYVDQSPMRRVGTPADVARAIAFLASDDAGFVNGETLRVDGGWAMGRYPREESSL
ncbi:SDR family NAD(P)-dependent oxidoreductase [Amorphus orientalis]|uniref:3-oxoacyl-[acyl-carrier protein] reductase n=1 Tax=Amorphus orientalis TaxID=649198 RepID=A0AAE3VMU3_9HYPH|nr:SDR family oxidoreductase [Amorphus orientalis]MDQ0314571.1 3-oxoacyl-[acyl-carrier protein] reductase [Amorphus orientalis]